jgi:hypothetical protein
MLRHVFSYFQMDAVSTSETSVNFLETTWRNIPEDGHLQLVTCRCWSSELWRGGIVSGYQRFGKNYRLHLQGEEIRSFETFMTTYNNTTRRHNPEDQDEHLHRYDNLKSQKPENCLDTHILIFLSSLQSSPDYKTGKGSGRNYKPFYNQPHGAQAFLRWYQFLSQSFTEPRGSLSCLQESTMDPHPEPYESSRHNPNLFI